MFVEFASVIEDVTERNADLTIAEPSVELVSLDKPVPQLEFAKEPVLLNVLELMEPSRPVVGIDAAALVVAEHVLRARPAITDAVMEHVNVFQTVTISTVVTTAVEDLAEPALMGLSAKESMIHTLDNVTSTVILKYMLKSESSKPIHWLRQPVQSPPLDPMHSPTPIPIQDPIPDIMSLIFQQENMEITNLPLTVLDINLMLRPMLSMFLAN